MKTEFGLCGPFDFEEKGTGGQSVKTREFYFALCDAVGRDAITILESTDYRRHPVRFAFSFIRMLRTCRHTVVFPAQNGIRVFAPLCGLLKGKHKTHYCVIGGWLPQAVKRHPRLLYWLKRFDTILVETSFLQSELMRAGLGNVFLLRNFKRLTPADSAAPCAVPLRLCYFSRIVREKGVEDAVAAVRSINASAPDAVCRLDIFGPIVPEYAQDFETLCTGFPQEIRYLGKVDPADSVKTLRNYDLQLFPTRYPTEGIPGSIIDSYFAGVPVVAARWNSFSDVVIDGETGVGYIQGNAEALEETLRRLIRDPERIMQMKQNCLAAAQTYLPENIMAAFLALAAGTEKA